MAELVCKYCGDDLKIVPGKSIAVCESCGREQTIPMPDDVERLNLFRRADELRKSRNFDQATNLYNQIVGKYPGEAEGYWGIVLCEYGIEYVVDPKTHKRIPTMHRCSGENLLGNGDYKKALENADSEQKELYKRDATEIETLRGKVFQAAQKKDPYDIFISFKDKDDEKEDERTEDSVIAGDLYYKLKNKGYRVFFSRETLTLGEDYEPQIYNALCSAKVMLLVGTSKKNMEAVWVRNEWSRYLKMTEHMPDKTLIVCYRNMTPADLPVELKSRQAMDLNKIGAEQDLFSGIEKCIGVKKKQEPRNIFNTGMTSYEARMKRGMMALQQGDWKQADGIFQDILREDEHYADAYLGRLMAEYHISQVESLQRVQEEFYKYVNFTNAVDFGDDKLRELLRGYAYDRADQILANAKADIDLIQAKNIYWSQEDFRDCPQKMKYCDLRIQEQKAVTPEDHQALVAAFRSLEDVADAPERAKKHQDILDRLQKEKDGLAKKAAFQKVLMPILMIVCAAIASIYVLKGYHIYKELVVQDRAEDLGSLAEIYVVYHFVLMVLCVLAIRVDKHSKPFAQVLSVLCFVPCMAATALWGFFALVMLLPNDTDMKQEQMMFVCMCMHGALPLALKLIRNFVDNKLLMKEKKMLKQQGRA